MVLQSAVVRIVTSATDNKLFWSEDLRPAWISTLGTVACISKQNVTGIENTLKCFDNGVIVVPPMQFNFPTDLNIDNTATSDNNMTSKATLKRKQTAKPRPLPKTAAKAKEIVVDGGSTGNPNVPLVYDEGQHVMNNPKVSMNLYVLHAMLNALIVCLDRPGSSDNVSH